MLSFLLIVASGLNASECQRRVIQSELNDCALARLEAADEALNRHWKVTFRRVAKRSSVKAEALRQQQRQWILSRDAKCDAEFPSNLGVSLDKMLNINCRATLTRIRTKELAKIY
jgi:uncharacterized protein YecT (DUF1311 family)